VEGEERMQISLHVPTGYVGSDPSRQLKLFNFDRLKSEELEKTLLRMSASLSKVTNRKAKKRTKKGDSMDTDTSPDQDVRVVLFQQGDPIGQTVDATLTNESAWTDGARLEIGSTCYTVQLNIPAIKQLTLPEIAMPGFIVRPRVVTEFAHEDKCQITWYKSKPSESNSEEMINPSNPVQHSVSEKTDMEVVSVGVTECEDHQKRKQETKSLSSDDINSVSLGSWMQIHEGLSYLPTDADVGHLLRIDCVPSDGIREGELVRSMSKYPVTASLERYPFEDRHKCTVQPSGLGWFVFKKFICSTVLYGGRWQRASFFQTESIIIFRFLRSINYYNAHI